MIELFIEYLDSIYWEGYAQQLASDNPQAYTFELNQFLDNYNFQSHEHKPKRNISESNECYPLAA